MARVSATCPFACLLVARGAVGLLVAADRGGNRAKCKAMCFNPFKTFNFPRDAGCNRQKQRR